MTEAKTDGVHITIVIKCVSLHDLQHNLLQEPGGIYTGHGSVHGALAMMT